MHNGLRTPIIHNSLQNENNSSFIDGRMARFE